MRFVTRFFAIIGFLTVLVVLLAGYAGYVVSHRHGVPQIAGAAVLKLDLDESFSETPPDPLRRITGDQGQSFQDLIRTIKAATDDDRIKGLVATAGDSSLGFAQVQEFRDALARFRAKGKFAYGFAESIGDVGGGSVNYYLLSGFDKIWLQPIGNVGLTGLDMETPFLKGVLDKLGIEADFSRRGEFKSAMTQLTETKLLPSDRAALDSLVGSLYRQLVAGIAKDRGLGEDKVRALIDSGPFLTDEALNAHLIDRIGYHDEFEGEALSRAGGGASFVDFKDYAKVAAAAAAKPTVRIALIRAVGMISSGSDDDRPFSRSDGVKSGSLVTALNAAAEDDRIRAIILRIDSPGGSDVASETIWRATQRARAKGKPVIVSMGDTAASGGYYIAAGADKIIAEPGTITGSIGVFGGKIVFDGLWQKIGLTWDHIAYGRNADIATSTSRFTPDQRRHTEAMLDQSYHTFLSRVAAGRHMTVEQVDAIGRGHVWTGLQASQNGLVDALGGLDTAVSAARKAINANDSDTVALISFPPPQSLSRIVQEVLSDDGGNPLQDRHAAIGLDTLAIMARMALSPDARAMMPPYLLSH